MKKNNYLWIWVIIIINVVIYAIEAPITSFRSPDYLFSIGGFRKDSLSNIIDLYRLLTCQFIHSGVIHLSFNMITFYYIVKELKRYQSSMRTLCIYIIGMIGVGISLLLFAYNNVTYVGNSGCIYALIFSWLYYKIKEKRNKKKKVKEELEFIMFLIISNFMPGVSWIMHLSGAVIGIITTVIMEAYEIKKG